MKNKADIRREMRALRSGMQRGQIDIYSKMIYGRLQTVPEFKACRRILCYVNFNQEVDTSQLIRSELASGRREVYIPRTYGARTMRFFRISDLDRDTVPGEYGISEPAEGCGDEYRYSGSGDVIIIPGLAFDCGMNRIGYGGGYYDTFLEKHKDINKIALCYGFQLIDECPQPEPTDVRVDMIITENGVYKL